MKTAFTGILMILLFEISFMHCHAADPVSKPELKPSQLECKFIIKKKKRKDIEGDFDDEMQMLYYMPKIYNRSKVDIEGFKVKVYIIGQSVVEKSVYTILDVVEYPLELKSHKTFTPDEKLLSIKFDDKNSYRCGYKYCTYIMTIQTKESKLFSTKCGKSKFKRVIDKLIKMKKGDKFDNKARKMD